MIGSIKFETCMDFQNAVWFEKGFPYNFVRSM